MVTLWRGVAPEVNKAVKACPPMRKDEKWAVYRGFTFVISSDELIFITHKHLFTANTHGNSIHGVFEIFSISSFTVYKMIERVEIGCLFTVFDGVEDSNIDHVLDISTCD